jgi:hypothetical protein
MPYTFALVAIPLIFYSPRSSRGHEELVVPIFFLRAAFDVAPGHDSLHSNPHPSLTRKRARVKKTGLHLVLLGIGKFPRPFQRLS